MLISGALINTEELPAICRRACDLRTDISTENPALCRQACLGIDTPALCPMDPLQQADNLFEGLIPKQLVPVKVAIKPQQEQVLFRFITAS